MGERLPFSLWQGRKKNGDNEPQSFQKKSQMRRRDTTAVESRRVGYAHYLSLISNEKGRGGVYIVNLWGRVISPYWRERKGRYCGRQREKGFGGGGPANGVVSTTLGKRWFRRRVDRPFRLSHSLHAQKKRKKNCHARGDESPAAPVAGYAAQFSAAGVSSDT